MSDLRTTRRSRPLLLCICTIITVLIFAMIAARFYAASRHPISKATLLRFADFQYASELTKADVTRLLGPPTFSDPRQPGIAERCHWKVEYPALVGYNSYQLTLCFSGSNNKAVIAAGLHKNGKIVRSD